MRKVLALVVLALLPLLAAAQRVDKVVAVAVGYSDYTLAAKSPQYLDGAAKKFAALVAEGSGGRHTISVSVHPTVITLNTLRPDGRCVRPSDADFTSAFTAAGVDLDGVSRMVILLATSKGGCNGGFASSMSGTVNGKPVSIKLAIVFTSSSFVVAHELSHTFGLGHAASVSCGCFTIGGKCSTLQYGNAWDVTGKANRIFQTQAANRIMLGWITPAIYTSGTHEYRLAPAYTPHATLPNALQVVLPKTSFTGDGTHYGTDINVFFEWRKPVGFDTGTNPSFQTGLMVNAIGTWTYVVGGVSYTTRCYDVLPCLLDMTPGDLITNNRGLQPGNSWRDPVHGITVQVVGIENDAMVVRVTRP